MKSEKNIVPQEMKYKILERKVWDYAREICMDLADETDDDVY